MNVYTRTSRRDRAAGRRSVRQRLASGLSLEQTVSMFAGLIAMDVADDRPPRADWVYAFAIADALAWQRVQTKL